MDQIPMKNQAQRPLNTQSGSIFIWIFVMIALFGALSYAMTQSSRSGASNLTGEKVKMAATEIVGFFNTTKDAFNNLVINGCDPLAISFNSTEYVRYNGTAVNTAPPSSPANCALFDSPYGVKAVSFEKYGSSAYTGTGTNPLPGSLNVRYADVANVGSTQHDLNIAFTGMDLQICVAVLNLVANQSSFTEVPFDTWGYGGNNSYTPGTVGSLNALNLPTSSMVWALRQASSPNYCQIGMIIKAN